MLISNVQLDPERLSAFCRKWGIAEMALFGSVLRDDFGPDSDVDFLVTFEPNAQHGFEELDRMEQELAGMVGREVDLVERRLVERSENYIRRRAILNSAERIYAAR